MASCRYGKIFYNDKHISLSSSLLPMNMNTEPIWKSWFARHGAKLLLFARQQARNPHDAEDLVQEAFVRIWRLYGHTGEVAPGLVYRAIRRLAIDWARSIDRRIIREQKTFELAPFSSAFEDNLEKDESNLNNEECDYKDLNTRLKEIKSIIVLLEKTIFK